MTVSRTVTGVERAEEVVHKTLTQTETSVTRRGDAILVSQIAWEGPGPFQTVAKNALLRLHVEDAPFIAELILKACQKEPAPPSSEGAAA